MLPAVARIVAIGDLHGDMDKARRAFRVAGLIDEQDRWAGGTTTAVQVRLVRRSAAILLLCTRSCCRGGGVALSWSALNSEKSPDDGQVGDQLDRGDDELQVLYFLERVAREAQVSEAARPWK